MNIDSLDLGYYGILLVHMSILNGRYMDLSACNSQVKLS